MSWGTMFQFGCVTTTYIHHTLRNRRVEPRIFLHRNLGCSSFVHPILPDTMHRVESLTFMYTIPWRYSIRMSLTSLQTPFSSASVNFMRLQATCSPNASYLVHSKRRVWVPRYVRTYPNSFVNTSAHHYFTVLLARNPLAALCALSMLNVECVLVPYIIYEHCKPRSRPPHERSIYGRIRELSNTTKDGLAVVVGGGLMMWCTTYVLMNHHELYIIMESKSAELSLHRILKGRRDQGRSTK